MHDLETIMSLDDALRLSAALDMQDYIDKKAQERPKS
jgi:hypothetical protein